MEIACAKTHLYRIIYKFIYMYIEFAHLKVVVGAVSLTLGTFYCLKKDKVSASEGPWLGTKKKVNQAESISKGLKEKP